MNKMNKTIPLDEQETVINFFPTQVNKKAEIYTCMPNVIKQLRNHSKNRPDSVQILKDEGDALFATIDRSCIKFTPKRKLSEEQRIAAAERLAKGRAMKT